MFRVLLSGFEPFGDNLRNPTGELARRYLNPTQFDNILVKGVVLPVVYHESWNKLKSEIESFHPHFILCLGLSPSDNAIRLELIATNYDCGCPDNQGKTHTGPIMNSEENKIKSDLPVYQIAKVLQDSDVAAYVSDNAGGYLCNHIFYQVMNYTVSHPNLQSGFVHLPNWPIDGESPRALTNVLRILLEQIGIRYRQGISAYLGSK